MLHAVRKDLGLEAEHAFRLVPRTAREGEQEEGGRRPSR